VDTLYPIFGGFITILSCCTELSNILRHIIDVSTYVVCFLWFLFAHVFDTFVICTFIFPLFWSALRIRQFDRRIRAPSSFERNFSCLRLIKEVTKNMDNSDYTTVLQLLLKYCNTEVCLVNCFMLRHVGRAPTRWVTRRIKRSQRTPWICHHIGSAAGRLSRQHEGKAVLLPPLQNIHGLCQL